MYVVYLVRMKGELNPELQIIVLLNHPRSFSPVFETRACITIICRAC